jgi:hypothetical protein
MTHGNVRRSSSLRVELPEAVTAAVGDLTRGVLGIHQELLITNVIVAASNVSA